MKTFNHILLTLSILFCGTAIQAQINNAVVEGVWKIKALKDSGKMIDLGAKETNVTINTKAKSITAYVGCNHFSSKFEFITADKIKSLELTATHKGCSDAEEALESTLRYALEQTNSIRKNGTKTEFYRDNDLLIVLERVVNGGKKKK
jgi:heat shock protein HslJ